MMGYIQGQAGDAYAGKWAVAPVLPGGGDQLGWLVARRADEGDRTRRQRSPSSSGCPPRSSR